HALLILCSQIPPPPGSPLFPYTTLFRSRARLARPGVRLADPEARTLRARAHAEFRGPYRRRPLDRLSRRRSLPHRRIGLRRGVPHALVLSLRAAARCLPALGGLDPLRLLDRGPEVPGAPAEAGATGPLGERLQALRRPGDRRRLCARDPDARRIHGGARVRGL